ncbi:MAG TPA: esterase [Ruminococcaceae bacterium]|nr:esterase [Oscillospiraceae bacterium]
MAFFNGTVYSRVLKMRTGLAVSTPADHSEKNSAADYPVVYLLHGLTDDHTCWFRYTSCERYAREHRVNLVMPEVQRSFYCDMEYGIPYFTYISKELPALVSRLFGMRCEKNSYVIGSSMGGYGALKCAFLNPGGYRGAAGFSAVADMSDRPEFYEREIYAINRHRVRAQDELFACAEKLTEESGAESCPELYITCGKQDFLYDGNKKFIKHLKRLGIPHTFEEWDAAHEWDFWDKSLKKAFTRFFGPISAPASSSNPTARFF